MHSKNRAHADGWTPRLARNLRVSWWYTWVTVLLFELALMLIWVSMLSGSSTTRARLLLILVSGLVWVASTAVLLVDYRQRDDFGPIAQMPRHLLPLAIALGFSALAGFISQSWLFALAPIVQSVVMLNWPRGVRLRLTLAVTVLLSVVAMVDPQITLSADREFSAQGWMLGFYSAVIPLMTVLSLWWWDMLLAFDRARLTEVRLAATQERLRVASDVHDLQGHHLQVIALQLELAERLLPSEPASGMEHLRAARTSVDEARQGTRDLAARFRAVPLRDEIENAADLLRAGGGVVSTELPTDLNGAPAEVLGPVIRETTTNVLRYGSGKRAHLAVTYLDGWWAYEIRNDVMQFASVEDPAAPSGAAASTPGSGLDGLRVRVREAGGEFQVNEADGEFVVSVRLPEAQSSTEPAAASGAMRDTPKPGTRTVDTGLTWRGGTAQ